MGRCMQNVEEKPWKNEELRKLEEALQRRKECHMEDVSRLYKAKNRSRVWGSSGLNKRNERKNRGVLGEGGAKWIVAATSMHYDHE